VILGQKLVSEYFPKNNHLLCVTYKDDGYQVSKTSEENFIAKIKVPFVYPSVRLDAYQAYG
jgi:hypothetical protein